MTLIPTNGVHITETQYPKGYQVAAYDSEGFAFQPRWFPTMDEAKGYANIVKRIRIVDMSV